LELRLINSNNGTNSCSSVFLSHDFKVVAAGKGKEMEQRISVSKLGSKSFPRKTECSLLLGVGDVVDKVSKSENENVVEKNSKLENEKVVEKISIAISTTTTTTTIDEKPIENSISSSTSSSSLKKETLESKQISSLSNSSCLLNPMTIVSPYSDSSMFSTSTNPTSFNSEEISNSNNKIGNSESFARFGFGLFFQMRQEIVSMQTQMKEMSNRIFQLNEQIKQFNPNNEK